MSEINIKLTLNTEFPLYLYDDNGNLIFYKNNNGYWAEWKYDENGNVIFYKNSYSYTRGTNPDASVELTLDEIAEKFNININNLKIKK